MTVNEPHNYLALGSYRDYGDYANGNDGGGPLMLHVSEFV